MLHRKSSQSLISLTAGSLLLLSDRLTLTHLFRRFAGLEETTGK